MGGEWWLFVLWVVTLLGDLEVISGCQGKVLEKFRRPLPPDPTHGKARMIQPLSEEQHKLFVLALEKYGSSKKGSEWSLINEMVGTNNVNQLW